MCCTLKHASNILRICNFVFVYSLILVWLIIRLYLYIRLCSCICIFSNFLGPMGPHVPPQWAPWAPRINKLSTFSQGNLATFWKLFDMLSGFWCILWIPWLCLLFLFVFATHVLYLRYMCWLVVGFSNSDRASLSTRYHLSTYLLFLSCLCLRLFLGRYRRKQFPASELHPGYADRNDTITIDDAEDVFVNRAGRRFPNLDGSFACYKNNNVIRAWGYSSQNMTKTSVNSTNAILKQDYLVFI